MRIMLQISALNVLILCLVGGFTIHSSAGKFEWGTVGPWALLMLAVSVLSYRYRHDEFDRFVSKIWNRIDSMKGAAIGLVGLVALLAFIAHLARWMHFSATYYDMGFLHQALFHPYEAGRWLMANLSPYESYLVDHFAPSLLLLSPLVAPFKSDVWMFLLQSAFVFLPVVYLLRRNRFSSESDRFFVAACLICSIALRSAAIWDFREDLLGYLFLIGALVALQHQKKLYYFGALIFFLLSKEHLWIIAFGLAVVAWFEYRDRRLAFLTAAIAAAWGWILFKKIIPELQTGLDLHAVNNVVARYRDFGATNAEIIRNILFHPENWLKIFVRAFANRESIRYLVFLLLPFGYGVWRKPIFLIAAFPGVLVNLASGVSSQRSLGFHYDIAFLPFLMMALVMAVQERPMVRTRSWFFLALALVGSGRWPGYIAIDQFPNRVDRADTQFLASIPCNDSENLNGGSIAGSISVLAHLTRCPDVRWLRVPEDCVFSREKIKNLAALDSSRLPEKNFLSARRIIVSNADACAGHLEEWLTTNGFKMHSQADFGRLKMFVSSESLGDAAGMRGGL